MKPLCRLTNVLGITILITVSFLAGCKKDNQSTPEDKQEFAAASSQADAEAELVFDDVFNNVMGVNNEVAIGGTGIFGKSVMPESSGSKISGGDSTTCFMVSYIQLNGSNRFPLQVVIDFGAGCTGKDGRTRRGKIILEYSGRLILAGNSATTTFEGYYLDSIKVQGTHKITNTSTLDKRSFTITISGAVLSKLNSNFTTWNSEKIISQVEGLATPVILTDDVFTLSGQANGSVKKGNKFFQWNTVITQPLVKRFTCRWIGKGTVAIQKNDAPVAILDYGTGQCDRKATLTTDGVTLEISLD
jgi:hypothetical protein